MIDAMAMEKAVKIIACLVLLLLLPFILDGRQKPIYTFTTSITLGQDVSGEHNPKVSLNEKGKQASADEINPLLRTDAAAPAGSSENSSTTGFGKAFKDWGLWVLLVLFSMGGLGFACNCYFKVSTVPAPSSSAPPRTTNLTIQLGHNVIAYNPPVHPVN